MGQAEKRRCLNCGDIFTPEPRNARHQRYCGLAPCKAASKRASQAKWLAKPENRDYHRGPEAVARVQAWRAVHPGYSRRPGGAVPAKASVPETSPRTITESGHASLPVVAAIGPQISCNAPPAPLQALLNAQPIVLVGLIAHIWGSVLQEATPHAA